MSATEQKTKSQGQLSYETIVDLLERGQWKKAAADARQLGQIAIEHQWYGLAHKLGRLLERLRDHQSHATFVSLSVRQLWHSSCPLPEWDGSDLSTRTLLVVCRNNHVAPSTVRFGRLLSLVLRRAKRCIVLVEPRLVAMFRRSFPTVDVRETGSADETAFADADVVASYETILRHVGVTAGRSVVPLPPLVPDPTETSRLRDKYRREKPVVGISWYSTNDTKDVPSLESWAKFLSQHDATYVSAQYGDVRSQVERLSAASGREVIYDNTVDAWSALDLFAAQLASLDAVVSISNTTANMSGALGVPLFVLLDDKNHLFWPSRGQSTSWYPSATIYHQAGRPWSDVFADISKDLSRKLAQS